MDIESKQEKVTPIGLFLFHGSQAVVCCYCSTEYKEGIDSEMTIEDYLVPKSGQNVSRKYCIIGEWLIVNRPYVNMEQDNPKHADYSDTIQAFNC